jgi:hypothetical protein
MIVKAEQKTKINIDIIMIVKSTYLANLVFAHSL